MAQALVVRCANAAQVQVYRSANGTLTAIGAAFTPTGGMLTDAVSLNKSNLAVQFGDALYCVVGSDVRKFVPASGLWVSETLPAFTLAGIVQHAGFHVVRSATGVLRLVVPLVVSGPNYRALYLPLGGAWTLGALGPAAQLGTSGFLGKGCQWRGQIHLANARDMVAYDPAADTWTVQNLGGTGATHMDVSFARARGRLFAVRTATGGANEYLNLYERSAGTWALVLDGSTSSPTLPQTDASGRPATTSGWTALHYDDTADSLILHAYQDRGAADRGWKCLQIAVTTLVVTNRTSLVPAALQYPAGPDTSGSSYDVHFNEIVENEDVPGSPTTTLWIEVNNGTWSSYQWINTTTSIADLTGSFGGRNHALPRVQQGGGEFFYDGSTTASPAYHLEELQARTPQAAGMRLFFRGYTFDETGGAPSSGVHTVAAWYNVTPQAPKLQGTLSAVGKLSGPGAVPTLVGNAAVGCTFDGTTIYYMDWSAIADGVIEGQNHELMVRIQ